MKWFIAVLFLFTTLTGLSSICRDRARPDSQGQICAGSQERIPTLADAIALKSINRVATNPEGTLVAIEARNEILILSSAYPFVQVKQLHGSNAAWSPNGTALAFYSEAAGKSQINVWFASADRVEQITNMPDGISPNWKVGGGLIFGDPMALAWSPDSSRIAFCSRLMRGLELLGKEESPSVRVLTQDTPYESVMEGVFRTGSHDGDLLDDKRTRAIRRCPEIGLNKLFIVEVQRKHLRQLNTSRGEPFYPSWSPDSGRVIATVDLDNNAQEWPTRTALVVYDLVSDDEQLIVTPLPISGPPRWSTDGSVIVLIEQQRLLGFPRIELYLWKEKQWSSIVAPKAMAVRDVRWESHGQLLLVETYDRFVNTLWIISTRSDKATQIDTQGTAIEYVDQAKTGDIFVVASSSRFAHRVLKLTSDRIESPQLIYDPNPQLSELWFGQQKRVTWMNKAGDEVDGILILPLGYQPGRRYPVLVDVYPSPARDTIRLLPDELGQLQAANGYLIFRPSLRSPHTPALYSRDENYNEKARGVKGIPIMLDDFSSGVDYLVRMGVADPNRIGIFGHSNGGWVVNYLITETHVAKCAVVWSGHSNVLYQKYFQPVWVDEITSSDSIDEYIRMSPLFRMNDVRTPVLMIVGDRDWDTWLPEMLMEFNALKEQGKEVMMVRYANEGHAHFEAVADISDFRSRVDAFFKQYLISEQGK